MGNDPRTMTVDTLRDEQGFPPEHTAAFLEVAKQTECVILTRTPGSSCEGPLAEGYAAKSFHIKAKSCNWGAAAGFLCLDPFMNKSGAKGAASNVKENFKSLTDAYERKTAGVISLQITEKRRAWLVKSGKLTGEIIANGAYFICSSKDKDNTTSIDFLLVKDQILPEAPEWRVYYNAAKLHGLGESAKLTKDNFATVKKTFLEKAVNILSADDQKKFDEKYLQKFWDILVAESATWTLPKGFDAKYSNYVPVLAMMNPNREYDAGTIEGYKNAVTGDYDLFAVWPQKFDPALDKRVAGMNASTTNQQIVDGENKNSVGKVAGNISERLYRIAQQLNSEIMKRTVGNKPGAYAVNRVFHSDEAGRPFLDAVDEAAAFTPDGKMFMVSPEQDKKALQLSSLMRAWKGKGYTIFANRAWMPFLDADIQSMVTWSDAIEQPAVTPVAAAPVKK